MQVSRELTIDELKETVAILQRWIDELDDPRVIDTKGVVRRLFPGGVPSMLSVSEIPDFPTVQFKSELMIAASKLEALAST